MNDRAMRVAVLTTLYPNSQQTHHGVFVEERLRGLVDSGLIETRVVAPVPWFFSTHRYFGRYASMASVPKTESRHGISIAHPRYLVLPKIGMTRVPKRLARAMIGALQQLRNQGFDFDVIDAHYLYPDGVAAAMVARYFDRPLVITARGTDVNVIAEMRRTQKQIRWAAEQAGALITVSDALGDRLARILGMPRERITTLRNGIDFERFQPMARTELTQRFDLEGPVWLCVGRLIESKGMHIAISALASVPEATLILIGEGADEPVLRRQAERLGVAERVCFEGSLPHDVLPEYFTMADVLMHAAEREGMPNVVLEALACGCAVIATPVGGIPEIMKGLPAGLLMQARDPESMRTCWQELVNADALSQADRQQRCRYAEQFGWEPTTQGQLQIFDRLTDIQANIDEPTSHVS